MDDKVFEDFVYYLRTNARHGIIRVTVTEKFFECLWNYAFEKYGMPDDPTGKLTVAGVEVIPEWLPVRPYHLRWT